MCDQIIYYIFYISASLFFIAATVFICFAGFYSVRILRNASKSVSSVNEIALFLKEKAANISNILAVLATLVEKIIDIFQEKHKRKKKDEDDN